MPASNQHRGARVNKRRRERLARAPTIPEDSPSVVPVPGRVEYHLGQQAFQDGVASPLLILDVELTNYLLH